MYVSPISIRLFTGRSTPTTRAISVQSPKKQFGRISNLKFLKLPLALLVLGVGADHAHHALAVDDLAVVAHLLDRSPNLHLTSPLPARAGSLVAVRDAPAVQVARQNAYEVLAHL